MTIKILLIDDDPDDRDFFREALETLSIVVCYTANDGHHAFKQLNENQIELPDLILLDINMPMMNGWQCLQLLKEDGRYSEIPVVMASTSSYSEDIKKAKTLGALCFLPKPHDFEVLRNSLETLVSHAASGTLHLIRDVIMTRKGKF